MFDQWNTGGLDAEAREDWVEMLGTLPDAVSKSESSYIITITSMTPGSQEGKIRSHL